MSDNKLNSLKEQKRKYNDELEDKVKYVREQNPDIIKDNKSNDQNDGIKNKPKFYETHLEAIQSQDYKLRETYYEAISRNMKFQNELRQRLYSFYMRFISIVTTCIFLVIIDPISLCRGVTSFYPQNLKAILLGAFFINVLSILVIMVRYSFRPSDKIIDAFNNTGNYNKKEH